MKTRALQSRLPTFAIGLIVVALCHEVVAQSIRGVNFSAFYGFDGVSLDTGYLGPDSPVRLQVRAYGGYNGKLLSIDMPGKATLNGCTMTIGGTAGAGNISTDFGLAYGAKAYFGIPDIGLDKEIDLLPIIGLHSLDLRWAASETFDPFLLGSSVTLRDEITKKDVLDIDVSNVILPGVPCVAAGVTLAVDASLEVTMNGQSIHISNPPMNIYNESTTISFCGGSTTFSYNQSSTLTATIGFWPGFYGEIGCLRWEYAPVRFSVPIVSGGLLVSLSSQTVSFDSTPAAPNSLSAVAVSSSQINLSWTDNSANETGFKIERRIGSGSWSQLPNRSANVTIFSDTGLAAGTAYSYRVRAYNAAGDSAYSEIKSATTQPVAGTTYTLNILSINPSSGVSVWSCPATGSCVNSATPTSRSFASGTAVGVACPSTLAGGLVFQKWQMDGNDLAFTTTTAVSMNGPHTVTAFFGSTPPPAHVLSTLFIEGPSGVDERNSAQYHARATYTDGSSAYVDGTAAWTDDSSYASISSVGLLDASAVSSDTDIVIEATFAAGGVSRRATKIVTIYNTDTVPTYTLTLSASHGYISVQPQMSSYPAGTEVRLVATPDDDYVFDHWSGNTSGTDRTIYIAMVGNTSITANFALDTSFGRLQLNLSPQQAVTEGAQWKYDLFTAWQDSGYLMNGISPRINRYVHFKDIPGWIKPDEIKTDIIGGQTTVTNATYREILGAVQVTISPDQASVAGARWRLDGGAWTESGVTLADVSTGNHTVQFLTISGWATPPSQMVSVARGITTISGGDYGPPAGLPIITSVSPRTGPIAGGTTVTIDGANFQAGASVSFGGVSATSVTVVSPARITAVTPPRASYGSVALALTSGGQTVIQANGFSYLNALGSNIELVGQIGGNVRAVAVVGNIVYYGEGTSLVVSDFTSPATPVERGRIALPSIVKGLAIVNNMAFVAVGPAGLYAVDVSTPAAPAIVGFFDTDYEASGVAVLGGRAYVADGNAGLQILDVTNPATIVRLGVLDAGGNATRVAVGTIASRQYAFVAESSGSTPRSSSPRLRVIDVTTPSDPVEVTNIPGHSADGMVDVKIVGTTLYVSDSDGGFQIGVRIFDASNPTNLVQIGVRDNVGPSFISVNGNRLYTCGIDLQVADLSVTPVPTNLGYFDPGGSCYDLAVTNNLAFAAMGSDGLKVVDVGNPASMSIRSAIQTIGAAVDVWVSGSVAFVSGGSGLQTVDVSNAARPIRLATLPGSGGTGIVVANGVATLVDGWQPVRIANVANPASVSLFGTYTNTAAYSVTLMGSTPVLAGTTKDGAELPKLDVLSISSPSSPQSTGSLLLDSDAGTANAIAVAGGWAFVVRLNKAVDVVSLVNPASPQKVSSILSSNSYQDIAVTEDGKFAYLAGGLGIQVVDVTVKAAPVLGQVIAPPQAPGKSTSAVRVAGNRLVANQGGFMVAGNRLVANQGGFIFVFDISNPASPQVLGYYDIPGMGLGIAVLGDLIFVADYDAGMSILRLKDVDRPTVAITTPTLNTAYSTNVSLLTLGGVASDDKGVVRVSWENNRGGGGVASGTTNWQIPNIQLAAGVNIITVTAEDANGNLGTDILTVTANLPDTTPPVVTITGPKPDDEFVVATNMITLSGSAADNQAVTNVTWSNNRGGSGAINLAGQNWSVTNLLLALGPNLIQVTATDSSGNVASDSAVIFFVPPDTNAPTISIEFPTLNAVYETGFGVLNLSGTAADNSRVTEIKWTSDHGGQGVANGVAPWSVNGIPLQPGLNVIEVTASDAAGNTATDALSVIYTPPPLRLNALGMSNGVFRLELSGPQITCVIQMSSDLVHWLPLSTNTIPAGGSVIIPDPGASNQPVRFYRAASMSAAATSNLPTLSATRLGGDLLLSWPTNFTGFTLETATNLPLTSWTPNSISPAIVNGQYTVTNAIAGGKKFYRLKK